MEGISSFATGVATGAGTVRDIEIYLASKVFTI